MTVAYWKRGCLVARKEICRARYYLWFGFVVHWGVLVKTTPVLTTYQPQLRLVSASCMTLSPQFHSRETQSHLSRERESKIGSFCRYLWNYACWQISPEPLKLYNYIKRFVARPHLGEEFDETIKSCRIWTIKKVCEQHMIDAMKYQASWRNFDNSGVCHFLE